MSKGSLIYRIPGAAWQLELLPEAVEFLAKQAQTRWLSKESVGQLYTKDLTSSVVRVDLVTKLSSRSASRTGVRLDMPVVQKERSDRFKEGLHCLGFWHSHPQGIPQPSDHDIEMAIDHAKAGSPTYAAIVFLIVGTEPFPRGLGVWVHDGEDMLEAVLEMSLESESQVQGK